MIKKIIGWIMSVILGLTPLILFAITENSISIFITGIGLIFATILYGGFCAYLISDDVKIYVKRFLNHED